MGEYGQRISNASELLSTFLASFEDEYVEVQLQLLTAAVKLFLKKPDTEQDLVQAVLAKATDGPYNSDLRDRAYVYWRLLSTDPQAAKVIVLSDNKPIVCDTQQMDASLLNDLVNNISLLASVYHKPPQTFLGTGRAGPSLVADSDKKRLFEERCAPAADKS